MSEFRDETTYGRGNIGGLRQVTFEAIASIWRRAPARVTRVLPDNYGLRID